MKMVPENILKLMNKSDRDAIGQQTIEEADESYHSRIEREEDKIFSSWLRLNGYMCLRANPSKKSTITPGWPDYSIFHEGEVIFIELKSPGAKLRPEQDMVCKKLANSEFEVSVCHSAAEAIQRVTRWVNSAQCEECGHPIPLGMAVCRYCQQGSQETETSINDYLNDRS